MNGTTEIIRNDEVVVKKGTAWPQSLYETETRVIGIPYCYGQPKKGVENGPRHIREHGAVKLISEMGFMVKDLGDIEFDDVEDDDPVSNVRRPRAIGKANRQIADKVSDSLNHGSPCLTLGGDHSLAIGSILGHTEATTNVGVIWIDAHADINPPQASGSGNTHGMPVAFLVKEIEHLIPKNIPEFHWVKPCISARDIAYIGLRDLDPAEKDIIEQYGITAFTMNDVVELGLPTVVSRAIAAVSHNNTRSLHLSFDIDALDPSVAPSTGTPVPGGLTLREGVYIVEKVAATGRLDVMDLVEVNPDIGSETDRSITLQSATEIISAWFGRRSRMQMAPGYSIPRP